MADLVNGQVVSIWEKHRIFDLLRNDRKPPLPNDALVEAVEAAVRTYPLGLRQRDGDGDLPVHLASETSPPEVFRAVINGWPDSVKERTRGGRYDQPRLLPIHGACRRPCSDQASAAAATQVVRLAAEAWPESLMEGDAKGRLPLHCALQWSTPTSHTAGLVEFLASWCPQALHERDDRGYLPFHYAVERTGIETVRYLVRNFPMSVTVRAKTNDSETALVLAIRAFVDPPTYLGYLVGAWPGALREPSTGGRSPLQEAVRVNNEAAVEYMLRTRPELARQLSEEDDMRLALHEAARWGRVSMSRLLVGAWPQGLDEASSRDGMLPLHEACRACEEGAVRHLLGLRRGAVRVQSAHGWLPIHFAVQKHPEYVTVVSQALDVAKVLVREYPESVWETTNDGLLPLHVAAGEGCSPRAQSHSEYSQRDLLAAQRRDFELVQFLVRQAPASVRRFSKEGMLPVHCAVAIGSSMDAIQFLLSEHDRDSAEEWPTTKQGRSVLHLAVSRDTPWMELVKHLVEQRANLVLRADRTGGLPVHDAARSHVPLEILQYLVERAPQALGQANGACSLPLHVCLNQVAPSSEKVRYLVEQHRPALEVADASGSLPLHVALAYGTAPLDLVAFLVDQHLPSLRRRNGKGLLPLHVAALGVASLDVLYHIASKFPEALWTAGPSNGSRARPLKRSKLLR
jgi:ankyrin repeat protein